MSIIAPHQLYTADGLAKILGCHRQSIYQSRVEIPPSIMIGDGERSRRWLGLSIINFLHTKSGFAPVNPAALLTSPEHALVPVPAPAELAEPMPQRTRERAIRLPKRPAKRTPKRAEGRAA